MKNKKGFGKTQYFILFKLTLLNVCGMSNNFMTNYVLA